MPRDSRISATRPVFPSFLLPTLKLGRQRRRSETPSSSSSPPPPFSPTAASASSSANGSPPEDASFISRHVAAPPSGGRLARAAPDTLRCMNCSTDLALASQIISKGFTGRYGRAFLVAPPPPPQDQQRRRRQQQQRPSKDRLDLVNIRVGRSEDRQLVTGWHVVADICCATCSRKLGWKYVDAREQSQKYKVGKYILEVERVMTHRTWEDVDVPDATPDSTAGDEGDDDLVVFDSEDEDECEDIFAGVWDAETVAKRRKQTIARRQHSAAAAAATTTTATVTMTTAAHGL
ncbi:hypothetical protein RJ55_07785 [Drechmeria coniospora]|nr:hypothetical protein RJ55_07785 [Drechmeria coniospora]